MKKEKQSAQVSASDAPSKDVAQVINEQTKLPESGKSQTNQSADGENELKGTLVDFVSELKKYCEYFAFDSLAGFLTGGEISEFATDEHEQVCLQRIWKSAKAWSNCGLDDETIKKQLADVFQICKLEKIYSQIDESTDKASATPEELKIKANGKTFSIAARKNDDGKFEFVEVNDTDTLLRAFKGSFAVWTQKSIDAKKMAEVRKMSAENFKQSKRKEYNNWIAEREARGLSTNKTFEQWFELNYGE